MRKRTRTLLFVLFAFLFLITAPAVVLYTQGFRVDFETWRIVETGGLALQPRPFPARVYLDEKLKTTTSFVFRNAVFRNLIPKNYNVRVEKGGYAVWQKTLEVRPRIVTEALNLRLFPQNPAPAVIAPKVLGAYPSPDGKYILYLTDANSLPEIRLRNTETNKETVLTSFQNGEELTFASWSSDAQRFLLEILEPKDGIVLATGDVQNTSALVNVPVFSQMRELAKADSRVWHILQSSPQTLAVLLYDAGEEIYTLSRINAETGLAQASLQGGIRAFHFSGDYIFYIEADNGILYKRNLRTGGRSQLTLSPLYEGEKVSELALIFGDEKNILALLNGALYLWKDPQERFTFVRDGSVLEAGFSDDLRKFAYWDSFELRVRWIKEDPSQPRREIGDEELVARASQPVGNAIWLPPDWAHLVFQSGENITVSELDGRGGRYEVPLAAADIGSPLFVSSAGDFLYSIENGVLQRTPLNGISINQQ